MSTSCSYHSGTFGIIHSQEGITCQFRTQQGKSSIAEQDQAGCVLKGIALHAASILHLGIHSQSLNSHLLPTRTLSSSCSFSLACSIVLSFAIALLRWFFMQISCFLRSGTFGTIHSQAHVVSIPHTAGQTKHGRGGPTVCMWSSIALHEVSIPHLGICSQGLSSHLAHSDALSRTCSILRRFACALSLSLLLVFFMFIIASSSLLLLPH